MKTKNFSLNARIKSFDYAFEGIVHFFKTEHNAWLHILSTITVVVSAVVLKVTQTELIALVFSIGFVFVTEIINTAIEKMMDFISVNQHPQIKVIKDIAAAAVLFAAFTACIIAAIIFIPKVV